MKAYEYLFAADDDENFLHEPEIIPKSKYKIQKVCSPRGDSSLKLNNLNLFSAPSLKENKLLEIPPISQKG